MDDSSTQTTLNIPSLVAFAVISFFAIRYFFFSPPSANTPTASASSRPARPFPRDRVDTVSTMFPQLSRRNIEWDLVRNGGSVHATSERVLREGRLPPAPPNFTPAYDDAALAAAAPPPASRGTPASRQQQKRTYEDLITRYNLGAKMGAADSAANKVGGGEGEDAIQSAEKQKAKGSWSANKGERQDLLKRRREEMVLAARRKMEERDRKGKEKAP